LRKCATTLSILKVADLNTLIFRKAKYLIKSKNGSGLHLNRYFSYTMLCVRLFTFYFFKPPVGLIPRCLHRIKDVFALHYASWALPRGSLLVHRISLI
jgi:hypothetical protein